MRARSKVGLRGGVSRPKAARPETLAQAVAWDAVRSRYSRDGFCDACAAQAAWGHQLGFANVRPACDECRGIVPTHRGAGARAQRWSGVSIPAAPQAREYATQPSGVAESAGRTSAIRPSLAAGRASDANASGRDTDVDGTAMSA